MKQYMIAGKLFELRPLTHRQRSLAAPMERRMREVIFKLASSSSAFSDPEKKFKDVYEISLDMDAIVFAEDCGFLKFLATILVPAEAEKWTPEMIEQNYELMWEIDEATQAEVLRDFFSRQMNSPIASPVSIKPSMSEQKPSTTSGDQKDSAMPTT